MKTCSLAVILADYNYKQCEAKIENTISFSEFGLDAQLVANLNTIGFEKSSPIQEQTIPLILNGEDIFAQAETGSGKTGAFAIPMIQKIVQEKAKSDKKFLALVLSPTRELAQQTHKAFETLGKDLVNSACLIGGENIKKQKETLQGGIDVLVGTPGRICDLARQRDIDFREIQSIIFDEADRLFDMGFKKEIESILKLAPKSRQLVMVSATTNLDVLQTAYRFHSRPKEISLSEDSLLVDNIDHKIAMISNEEKFPFLVNVLRKMPDAYAIVFCNTQIQTHRVAHWLKAMNFKASPISGRLTQNKRNRLMEEFRSKDVTILVCTDVAARGLDIKDVNLVVNFDLPSEAANYVHRIGRTGRAGESGEAISLCAYEDCEHLEHITTLIEVNIPKMDIEDSDFATDICPEPKLDMKTLNLKSDRPKKERNTRHKNDRKTNKNNKENNNHNKKKQMKTEKRIPMTPFEITTTSFVDAQNAAKMHFNLDDLEKLNHNILKKGSKKFLLFGPQEVTYEFTVQRSDQKRNRKAKNIQSKKTDKKREAKMTETTEMTEVSTELNADQLKVKNIANEIIDKMHLEIERNFYMKGDTLHCELTGEDVGLFLTNRKALLISVETLVRQIIFRQDDLNNETRVRFTAKGTNSRSNDKGPRRGKGPKGDRKPRNNYENSLPDAELEKMANELKDLVLETGQDQLSKPLNAKERRIIHTTLQDMSSIETESMGDGRLKQVRVYINNI